MGGHDEDGGFPMQFLWGAICAASLCLGAPALAQMPTGPVTITDIETPSHGGGCRKDSPPGKCCHAGSKPYHCH
jgi:hypothetical protein